MSKLISIDLSAAEGYNARWDSQLRGWVTRGSYDDVAPVNAGTPYNSAESVYGFSVRTASGGEYHYIVYVNPSDQMLIVTTRDEHFEIVGTGIYAPIVGDPNVMVVTHAVVYNQIIINSPQFPYPLHAYIGGVPTKAEKGVLDPPNPDLPPLNLLSGIVGQFQDRIVWGIGNQVIISSPGTDPRILQANNAIAFSGKVTDIVQDPSGSLVIGTTDGLQILPADGLQFATYQGNIRKIPINTLQPGNVCANSKMTLVLGGNGVYTLSGDFIQILQPDLPRRLTLPPFASEVHDMRRGLLQTDGIGFYYTGHARATTFLYLDQDLRRSWMNYALRSVMFSGPHTLLLSRLQLRVENGNLNHAATTDVNTALSRSYRGAVHFALPISPDESNVVRHLHVTTKNEARREVQSHVFGGNTVIVEEPKTHSRLHRCNTQTWGADRPIYSAELRSTQIDMAIRTDGRWAEIGIDGGMVLYDAKYALKGQGKRRR
jgi:hypothetical protein